MYQGDSWNRIYINRFIITTNAAKKLILAALLFYRITRTWTGTPLGSRFSYHYSFHYPFGLWSGLYLDLQLHLFRSAPSSLYTRLEIIWVISCLARDCHQPYLLRFPRIWCDSFKAFLLRCSIVNVYHTFTYKSAMSAFPSWSLV